MITRALDVNYILLSGLTLNASQNAGGFIMVPLARNWAGECGSVLIWMMCYGSRNSCVTPGCSRCTD